MCRRNECCRGLLPLALAVPDKTGISMDRLILRPRWGSGPYPDPLVAHRLPQKPAKVARKLYPRLLKVLGMQASAPAAQAKLFDSKGLWGGLPPVTQPPGLHSPQQGCGAKGTRPGAGGLGGPGC